MIEMLKKAFHALLDENDWLTPETRQVASEKVQYYHNACLLYNFLRYGCQRIAACFRLKL